MSPEDKYAYKGIKIIFSLVSVMLMVPLLVNTEQTYYRTLFIFLIGKVVDLFFKDESGNVLFFKIWDIANQIIGAFACAFAFCSMIPDFVLLFKDNLLQVNVVLMICVISCMLKDVAELVVLAIKIKSVKKEINYNIQQIYKEK